MVINEGVRICCSVCTACYHNVLESGKKRWPLKESNIPIVLLGEYVIAVSGRKRSCLYLDG